MNMISQLRQRINAHGETTISIDEFNQLQAEWIQRIGSNLEWKNTTSDGLPPIGEQIFLFTNGAIQQTSFYLDGEDNDLCGNFFWASDHIDLSYKIKETDLWILVDDIPDPK